MELRGAPLKPFLTAGIARRAGARQRAGLPVVAMHFGQPSEGPTAAALAAARGALELPDLGYWESGALRARLARHYRDTYAVDVTPERILLTAGASAGLVAVFATAFRAGDRVAIVCPGYPAYRNALTALGLVPVELRAGAADGYRLSPQTLANLEPVPEGLLLASPANPTGTITPAEDLERIAQICRQRGIRLISDEIYHGLSYGLREACALEFEPQAMVLGSFSKFYRMPGWRLGWLIVPPGDSDAMHETVINLFLTPSALSQHAALAAMEATTEFRQSVERYARNRTRLLAGLEALGIQAGAPDGAFYLYADFGRYTRDSLRFCERAVDEIGVGMAPGVDFDPVGGTGHVRLCFAISEAELEQALGLLASWLPSYRD